MAAQTRDIERYINELIMGLYEHKVKKNQGKAKIIWNSLRGVKSKGIINRDDMSGITEVACPVGVVGAVTPCTNPIVTRCATPCSP